MRRGLPCPSMLYWFSQSIEPCAIRTPGPTETGVRGRGKMRWDCRDKITLKTGRFAYFQRSRSNAGSAHSKPSASSSGKAGQGSWQRFWKWSLQSCSCWAICSTISGATVGDIVDFPAIIGFDVQFCLLVRILVQEPGGSSEGQLLVTDRHGAIRASRPVTVA